MNWLADQVEVLAKQASEITMYDVKSTINKAKNIVLNLSEIESKVREATNDDPWGASSTLMQEIAQSTFNFQLFNEIMPCIYARFTEKEARQWRQIYKALVLLEYLVKNGSERVIDDARSHLSLIKVLRNFHYTDENAKDQGINVRNRSKELAELLSDLDRVRQERRKAKQNRNKYTGVGNDGFGGGGGGGPSFTSATGSRYGGFGSDSFEGGSGGGGGGHSSGFSDSRAPAGEFEEYDAGEWEDSDRRGGSSSGAGHASSSRAGSSRTSAPTRAASKPTPPPPKPAAPAPEVNLFDFDDDEQQPTPPPKFTAAMPAANLDDDFDDFQSATPAPAAPAPAQPAKANQNVFDLLNAQPPRPTMAAAPAPAPMAAAPMSNFAPLQAQPSRPALQPQTSSFSAAKPATPAAAPAPKAASDFSDLFGDFGGASSSKPAGGAAGGAPKLTIAQMQAQKRQDSLFAAPSGGASQGGASGWDSLL
ncbi:hypothetical protein BCR35DRAFT_306937 [Leucosporidium creatinivorum]|uniref:ENTH domain-containing protein n=1 Tax=Leucosporidium creatinivorum TaxID=106004 RepID=A0A1Y2EQG8_9BASI|nr:hypothetical protein BCR35DRAFT_306937 [Leucosporidium creatinivorum]